MLGGRQVAYFTVGGQAGDFPPISPAACYASEDLTDSPEWNRNDRQIQ
jgi:hypothetical protein